MASKNCTLAVHDLTTNDPYADKMIIFLANDYSFSQIVGVQTVDVKAGVQQDLAMFDGLVYGQTYYLGVQTFVSVSGIGSGMSIQAVVAGNPTPPYVVYSYTSTAGPGIQSYRVTPVVYPSNIDHYEAYWAVGGYDSAPLFYTEPKATAVPDSSGKFQFTATTGADLNTALYVYVRAVNTDGIKQDWQNLAAQTVQNQVKIKVRSCGAGAINTNSNSQYFINEVYAAGDSGYTIGRGWNLLVFNSAGQRIYMNRYDPTNSGLGVMTNMANDIGSLATSNPGCIMVVFTHIDPGIPTQFTRDWHERMKFIGASQSLLMSDKFRIWSAYILIGRPYLGIGNGIEVYAGSADYAGDAACETSFYLHSGEIIGTNGSFPAAMQIDASQGQMAANGSIPPSLGSAFTYTCNEEAIHWSWEGLYIYRMNAGLKVERPNPDSLTNTRSYRTSGLASSTQYFIFPYFDDNPASTQYRTVYFVNQIGGGEGYNILGQFVGNMYRNYNQSCTQYMMRFDHIPLSAGPLKASTLAPPGSGQPPPSGGGSYGGSGTCLLSTVPVTVKGLGKVDCVEARKGDFIETPGGWAEVVDVSYAPNELWVGMTFEGYESDGEILSTLNHEWALDDGTKKTSSELTISDLIPTKNGVTYAKQIRILKKHGIKVRLTIDSADHLFYIGSGVATHNMIENIPC